MLPSNFIIPELTLKENPLSSLPIEKKQLKQASKPQNLIYYNSSSDKSKIFISPYGKKHSDNISCDVKPKLKFVAPKANAMDLLNESRDKNSPIDGWSARQIVEHRKDLEQSIKPETLEAIRNLKNLRMKKAEKVQEANNAENREAELLCKINEACKEPETDAMEVDAENVKEDKKEDLSFLPIHPDNPYVNMNKLEMNKLEWMKYIDLTTQKSKFKSIRFHLDGSAVAPEIDNEEDALYRPPEQFDAYVEALNHHGEEPERNGYTISELFYLARSSFGQQRNLAVQTITNMVARSARLEHVHYFNMPAVTQSLVDCGLVFLARWLIDDAGVRQQHLLVALSLLHAVLVREDLTTSDDITWSWPDTTLSSYLPRLMGHTPSRHHKRRLDLPPSERANLYDDQLMAEDVVSCLVTNTFLLDRFSYLWVDKGLSCVDCPRVELLLLEILGRIASHSLEMASSLVHNHDSLVTLLIHRHIVSSSPDGDTDCMAATLRLVRILCQTSPSMAHKLTRDQAIITALYPILVAPPHGSGHYQTHIEALRLVSVLATLGIHCGPIAALLPSLLDRIAAMLAESPSSRLCHASLACLASLLANSSKSLVICRDMLQSIHKLVQTALDLVASVLPNCQSSLYSTFSLLVHLTTSYYKHEYRRPRHDMSSHQLVANFYNSLICPLLDSALVDLACNDLAQSSLLGYEHQHSHLNIFDLDLTNLLHDPIRLACKTRNPRFVDCQPFFIELHSAASLLSSVGRALSFLASTRVSPRLLLGGTSERLSALLDRTPHLIRLVTQLADAPMATVAPIATYSIGVQLELDCLSSLIVALTDLARWTGTSLPATNLVLYRAVLNIVPHLGPRLYDVGRQLLDSVLFSREVVESVAVTLPQQAALLLLKSLPATYELYRDCLGHAKPTTGHVTYTSIDDLFVRPNWSDRPFLRLYKQKYSQEPIDDVASEPVVATENVLNCVAYTLLLDTIASSLSSSRVTAIHRLAYLLISVDWFDQLLLPSPIRSIISTTITSCLANPASINLSHKLTRSNTITFYGLHSSLLDQYFDTGACDPLFANFVLFPCAMRFPIKYRRTLWKMHLDTIKTIHVTISETTFPISEFLQPEETNNELIRTYWNALRQDILTETENELLYWICIHHLNRFVFNQTVILSKNDDSNFTRNIQQGMAHAICNASWQNKSWVQHVRLYKQFGGSTPLFYNELPASRLLHLNKLQHSSSHHYQLP